MTQRAEAYIIDAIRTPTGRRRGSLAQVHGADLGASVLKALVARQDIPEDDYDDVIFGCVDTVGPLAGDIARTCWLAAGLSDAVPGRRLTDSVGPLSRQFTLLRKPSCPEPWTWSWQVVSRP